MKVLYVTGDDDYGALTFEEEMGVEKAKEILALGEEIPDGDNWYAKVMTFKGGVDPDFIAFIQGEIQDYDDTKHHQFYILENEGE